VRPAVKLRQGQRQALDQGFIDAEVRAHGEIRNKMTGSLEGRRGPHAILARRELQAVRQGFRFFMNPEQVGFWIAAAGRVQPPQSKN
jgi:hypothetical protein